METRNSKTHTIPARLAALLLTLCMALGTALGIAPEAHALYVPIGSKVTVTDNRNGGKVTGIPTRVNRNADGTIASVDGTVTNSTDPLVPTGTYRVIVTRTEDGKKSWTLHRLSGGTAASNSSTSSPSSAASPSETAADSGASASDAAGSDTGSELVMSGGLLVLQDEDGNLVDMGATVEGSSEDTDGSADDAGSADSADSTKENTITLGSSGSSSSSASSSASAKDTADDSVIGVIEQTVEKNAAAAIAVAAAIVALVVIALAIGHRRRIRAAHGMTSGDGAPRLAPTRLY